MANTHRSRRRHQGAARYSNRPVGISSSPQDLEEEPRADTPPTKFKRWWIASKKTKTKVVALVLGAAALLGASDQIKASFTNAWEFVFPPSQSEADSVRLNSIRTGVLLPAFERSLDAQAQAVIWRNVEIDPATPGLLQPEPVRMRDQLYVLDTVFVQAFIDQNDTVVAFTVTARSLDMPQNISILGRNYDLGKTTLGDAPLDSIVSVAAGCGAHIAAFYEGSGTNGAHGYQTVAVGATAAGAQPEEIAASLCQYGDPSVLPPYPDTAHASDNHYQIELRSATSEYLERIRQWRAAISINSITVTADGIPLIAQMLSLHPADTARFPPK